MKNKDIYGEVDRHNLPNTLPLHPIFYASAVALFYTVTWIILQV